MTMNSISDISSRTCPEAEEVEITLLGNGGKYGESVVVHSCNNEWYVVDSCVDGNGKVLPLTYLELMNVDKNQVKGVVCTHWHEDHIKGMSQVLDACPNAKFFFAKVGNMKDFLGMLINDVTNNPLSLNKEFVKCIDIVEKKKMRHKYLNLDTALITNPLKIHSLSPSDGILDDFDKILLRYDGKESKEKISPNLSSIALYISKGNIKALLGADLEKNHKNKTVDINVCSNYCDAVSDKGWCNVLKDSIAYEPDFNFIKVPHHSSITAYCPKIWKDKKVDVAVSTIFVRGGDVLPTNEMLSVYNEHSEHFYLTSPYPVRRRDKKGRPEEKVDNDPDVFNEYIISDDIGIVSSRKKPADLEWRTELYGSAITVDKDYIEKYEY